MAIRVIRHTGGNGFPVTREVDSDSDHSAIPINTYFKQVDLNGLVRYKDASSNIVDAFEYVSVSLPQANTLYVDSVNGVDATATGTINAPYKTIEYMVANIVNTGTFTCTTATSRVLSAISDVNYALLKVGDIITGSGIAYNSIIESKDGGLVDAKSITISKSTTATATLVASTWITPYTVFGIGTFSPTGNIYKLGFYYDFEAYHATVNIGNFALFVFVANVLIPFGFKLGRTYGNHINSSLHNTGAFSGIDCDINYGDYYSIGTDFQLGNSSGQWNYSGDVNISGKMFDARFGYISYLYAMSKNFTWSGNAYGLLGGVRGTGALSTNISGVITTPASVLAINSGGEICNVYGSIRGSVTIAGVLLQTVSFYADVIGTTFTAGNSSGATITNLHGKITANLVVGGMVNVYSLIYGNITVNDALSTTVCNLYGGCVGTITATSGTVMINETFPTYSSYQTTMVIGASGAIINNGIIRGNFSFIGAGKLVNRGTLFTSGATNVGAFSTISNAGTLINEATGIIRNDGTEVVPLLNKSNGTLINNGRMVSSVKMYVNYTVNDTASRNIIIQNSFTNGNSSNGGVGKGTGLIRYINITAGSTDTSITFFDGTNTVTIAVVGGVKSIATIIDEYIVAIKSSILLFQYAGTGLDGRLMFIGLQLITTTATGLINATTGTWNGGGGFAPIDLVGGTEVNNENLNY